MIKFIFITIFCAFFLAISINGEERGLYDDELPEEGNDFGLGDLKGYFDMSSMLKGMTSTVAAALDEIFPLIRDSMVEASEQAEKARRNATLNMKSLNATVPGTNSTVSRPE